VVTGGREVLPTIAQHDVGAGFTPARSRAVAIVGGMLATSVAHATEPFELHGYAKATASAGLTEPVVIEGLSRLQLDASGRQGPADFRATFDVDLEARAADPGDPADRSAELSLLPVELKVGLHPRAFDLVVGKQYIFWGQTDWANPTDLFTPWDYVNISNELEDYRIAPWGARATGYLGDVSLDLVWVPLPQPHAMGLEGMATDEIGVGDPVLPARDGLHGDLGARLNALFLGFDTSVMFFRGMDKRPSMNMTVDFSQDPWLILEPHYGGLSAVGGDLSRAIGDSLLLKVEIANYWTEDLDGDDPVVRNPELYSVAGLTWVPHPNVNFTVQGTSNHLWAYDPDADIAALQAMGDPDPQVDPVDAWGLVERGAWTWKDTVSVSVVGVQGLPEGDHMELAYVSWRAADGLTVLAGALVFGGPEDTRFGAMKAERRAFAEVKYSF
jgi:hypothetical protein